MMSMVNESSKAASGKIILSAQTFNTKIHQMVPPLTASYSVKANDTSAVEIYFPLGNKMILWDEFDPALYMLYRHCHQ